MLASFNASVVAGTCAALASLGRLTSVVSVGLQELDGWAPPRRRLAAATTTAVVANYTATRAARAGVAPPSGAALRAALAGPEAAAAFASFGAPLPQPVTLLAAAVGQATLAADPAPPPAPPAPVGGGGGGGAPTPGVSSASVLLVAAPFIALASLLAACGALVVLHPRLRRLAFAKQGTGEERAHVSSPPSRTPRLSGDEALTRLESLLALAAAEVRRAHARSPGGGAGSRRSVREDPTLEPSPRGSDRSTPGFAHPAPQPLRRGRAPESRALATAAVDVAAAVPPSRSPRADRAGDGGDRLARHRSLERHVAAEVDAPTLAPPRRELKWVREAAVLTPEAPPVAAAARAPGLPALPPHRLPFPALARNRSTPPPSPVERGGYRAAPPSATFTAAIVSEAARRAARARAANAAFV